MTLIPVTLPPLKRPLNSLEYDYREIVRKYVDYWRDLVPENTMQEIAPFLGPMPRCPRPLDAEIRYYVLDHRLRVLMLLVPKSKGEASHIEAFAKQARDEIDYIFPDFEKTMTRDPSDGNVVFVSSGWVDCKEQFGFVPDEGLHWPSINKMRGDQLDETELLTPFQLFYFVNKWGRRNWVDWKQIEDKWGKWWKPSRRRKKNEE